MDYRSVVAVPLLHEGNPIGVITVARADAGAFPERQIALLQAFADQAVIAIRNVGLFDEVQARTEELSGPAAANGDRRCAQSYQPLDLRLKSF